MKKTLSIIIVAFCLGITVGRDYSFNLGALPKGEKAERTVWMVNSSSSPVCINDVETGCVCTKAKFSKDTILPGDSTAVHITFSAKDKGVFYKIIEVKTNCSNCNFKVTLRGKVN